MDFMCKRKLGVRLAETLKVTLSLLMAQYIFFNEVIVESHQTTARSSRVTEDVSESVCLMCMAVCAQTDSVTCEA